MASAQGLHGLGGCASDDPCAAQPEAAERLASPHGRRRQAMMRIRLPGDLADVARGNNLLLFLAALWIAAASEAHGAGTPLAIGASGSDVELAVPALQRASLVPIRPLAKPVAPANQKSVASGISEIVHDGGLSSAKPAAGPRVAVASGAAVRDFFISLIRSALYLIVFVLSIYTLRHYIFTLNRLFGRQRHPYVDIDTGDWPTVTILVAAHNEEAVIAGCLKALLDIDYPEERLRILPMNDRSTDRTKAIIDDFVVRHPGRITPFHRTSGKPGKAAALKDAMAFVQSKVIVVFDADYVPSRGLIKQLVAPFFDPEIGAVMGRVVPLNVDATLLTRLLDLERSGGYQVDQQARMNLGLVAQYGGTVGGVRVAALNSIGGWHDDVLAEDTDLTYRLLLAGWKTVYQNRSECYEEVPEAWPVRVRQIMRWTKGHNQTLFRYGMCLARSRRVSLAERVDGLLLLGVYAVSPLLMLGWGLMLVLYYLDGNHSVGGFIAIFALMSYSALGNFAAFFEIAAAVHMDGNRQRIKLLPLNCFGFLISLVSISRATVNQVIWDPLLKRKFSWDKTVRYRKAG